MEPGQGRVGGDFDGTIEVGQRAIHFSQRQPRGPTSLVAGRLRGIEFDGLIQVGDGLRRAPLLGVKNTSRAQGIEIARRQQDCLIVVRQLLRWVGSQAGAQGENLGPCEWVLGKML